MKQFSNFVTLASSATVALGQFCEHEWEGDFADYDVDGVPHLLAAAKAAPPPLDIQPLIVTGPSSNRVDLIFFGDGCTFYAVSRPTLGLECELI